MRDGGELLRTYRVSAGMSQQSLAVALGVSLGIVSKWERGENVPTYSRAVEIDDYFQAGGELVSAFGFVKPGGEVAELRAQLAELWEQVQRVAEELSTLSGEVRRGRGRARKDGT